MSLGVYELQRTIDEVQRNIGNEDGLLPESKIELLQTNAELRNELDTALGQTVLFAVQFDMLDSPASTEVPAGESDLAGDLTGQQDALFPKSMIKQEGS